MIKTLIIDGNHQSAAQLSSQLIKTERDVDIMGTYSLVDDAIQSIDGDYPDVVFIDVSDRSQNYSRHLQKLKNNDVKIIYLSSTTDRAHEAIRVEASDYLLKPINGEAIELALEKVEKSLMCQCNKDIKIKFPNIQGIRYINASDIFYIKSNGNYTWVYNTSSERFLSNYNMKDVEELLRRRHFQRTHNQYIVNLSKVQEYRKSKKDILILSNGDKIPLSRMRRQATLDLLDRI